MSLRALAPRIGLALLALYAFSLSIVMNLQANLGLAPWQAFHYGLSLQTPLTFGQANQVVGLSMVLISLALGVWPGVITVASMALVGLMIDWLIYLGAVPRMSGLLDGIAMLLAGVMVTAFGTALTVLADLGTGPRDSFMLAVTSLTRRRVGLVRGTIEIAALGLGYLMGAPVGIGTVVYALGIGPAVEIWFTIFGLKAQRNRRREELARESGDTGRLP